MLMNRVSDGLNSAMAKLPGLKEFNPWAGSMRL